MRIAWVSPLPPEPSGISDYCAELLPHLARSPEVERLDLYVEEGRRPDPVPADLAVDSLRHLAARAGEYDAIVYHLGNNGDHHAEIYRTLCAMPGIVVLHEYMLHHLIRAVTLARGNPAGYVEEMRYAYGRSGQSMAKRFLASGLPFDTWSYPLFERTVDASRAVLVHNEHARERIHRSRPAARVGRAPMLFDPTSFNPALFDPAGPAAQDPTAARQAARAELGIAEGTFVVASFGFVTPAKRLPVTLEAFRRLRREVPDAAYLIVGEVSPHYDFASVLDRGLEAGVLLSGRIALDAFERAMLAADVAINLRFPTGGETSASLIRLLGLGIPTIVSWNGSFAEIPPGCCLPVDLDETETDLLAAYLIRLARDPDLRRQIGASARAYVAEHHSPRSAVDGYLSFLAEVIAARPEPYRAVPPLAPWPEAEIGIELAAEVAGALADLGIDERDDESLRSVAEVLSDLRRPGISSAPR